MFAESLLLAVILLFVAQLQDMAFQCFFPSEVAIDVNGTQYILHLLHTIRPQDQFLEVELERMCGGSAVSAYQYKFERI